MSAKWKCIYCDKVLKRTDTGCWIVCECDNAEQDWFLNMNIERAKKQLSLNKKELSELRETFHNINKKNTQQKFMEGDSDHDSVSHIGLSVSSAETKTINKASLGGENE